MIRPFAAALALSLAFTASSTWAAPSTDPAKMPAGLYVLDPDHASLIARVNHQGFSRFTMRFRITEARYTWDPASPQTAEVRATVDTKSFDTGAPTNDARLAKDFLDTDKFPTATFVSTSIQPGETGMGKMTGDLTLHGVTRPVTFDVTWNGYASGIFGQRSGFSARATIKRSDFGIDHLLNPPLGFVGDQVELTLELEFLKK
jgi:polyisoprenoid-binding protein YceI